MLGEQAGAGALGWACVGRWAGVRGALGRGAQQAWRAAGARSRRTGAGGRTLAQASGSWAQAQAGGRVLGARQGAGRARPGHLG